MWPGRVCVSVCIPVCNTCIAQMGPMGMHEADSAKSSLNRFFRKFDFHLAFFKIETNVSDL